MGEIADDMVNGECCSLCGIYFVEGHGYPVLCHTCFEEAGEDEQIQEAVHKEL